MAGQLIEDTSLRNKTHVFKDRSDAGLHLAELIQDYISGEELVLAIPSGGVPVAFEIAAYHSLPMDLVLTRKIQIPGTTEAGFGAVDPDGTTLFNTALLQTLRLSDKEIAEQTKKTLSVIAKRNMAFRKDRQFPNIKGKSIILVDDGLASGYTMLASIRFVKRKSPRSVIVAVPTSYDKTMRRILLEVDGLACLNIRDGYSFAVADAYQEWHDVTDEEVLELLEKG